VPVLLPIHIISAAIALVAGAVALSFAKGRTVHRRAGILFVYAIFAMCGSALISAIVKGQVVNVMAASMTAYLTFTALMTVRPPSPGSRRLDVALMVMALALGVATFAGGLVAIARPSGRIFGLPSFPFFMFGILGLSGAYGDFKTMRSGGLRGAPRLSRHLWRMSMAMFITTASFFSIRARVAAVLPPMFTTPVMRTIPVVMVLAVMFYWLWRVRSGRPNPAGRWPPALHLHLPTIGVENESATARSAVIKAG